MNKFPEGPIRVPVGYDAGGKAYGIPGGPDAAALARLTAHNKKERAKHLRAVHRWADSLNDRVPPKRTTWWNGDPYGKPPESTVTWANRVARENPPKAFQYTPGEGGGGTGRCTHSTRLSPNPCPVKRAKSITDAKRQFRKLGAKI